MEKNLAKSLTDLIDETLAEIEALKKSDRFSAESIELGHDADGDMATKEVAAKAEDEDKEDEEHEEEEAEEEDEAKKAEKAYHKAEEECEKAEKTWKDAMKKRDMCKAEMKMAKKEDDKEDKKEEDKEEMDKKLSKSIDARIAPIESQISELLNVVKQLADAPVPARGYSYKNVQPLAKGAVEAEPLNKSQVLDSLITLKKSGKDVSVEDVLKAEIGNDVELQHIANKYGIK